MKPIISISIFATIALLLFLAGGVSSTFAQDDDRGTVYFIPFEGEVENALYGFLSRGFREAEQLGADHIIFEMDTPGGRVDSALKIADLIMDSPVPVTVFVTGNATSAGAIISLAAERIYMRQRTTIGTAAPVTLGQESETMNAKALSFVLAQVRTICERREYDELKTQLALAMVDTDLEVADPNDPDVIISPAGKLLTLTAQEALDLGFIEKIIDVPGFTTPEKAGVGREAVLSELGMTGAKQLFLNETAVEVFARFLSSTFVSSLLLSLAFLGVFIEFRTPGFGVPGAVGVIAFLLFFFSHSLTGLAGYEGLLFFFLGLALLSAEVFIIPGFGVAGIAGIFCLLASVVLTLMDTPITTPGFSETFEWSDLSRPLMVTTFSVCIGLIGAMASPLLIPVLADRRLFGNWLILGDSQQRAAGYHSAEDGLDALMGLRGVAHSALRPAGIADINGKRIDVVSQGGFIPTNSAVEVIKVEGRRIVVKVV
ncbi:MAG: NfeD family protein [Candidatus Hinthialibacter antarcticus]|nr:NfeD family protein [Candidatus Hinthialibacter antarcticus]